MDCLTCSTTRETVTLKLDDHYKKVCAGCGRYVAWAGIGETRYLDLVANIDLNRLSRRDSVFITQVVRVCYTHGHELTDRQRVRLDNILAAQ